MLSRLVLIFLCMLGSAQSQTVLSWKFLDVKSHEWKSFGEKGSIKEALFHLGDLPDPFYGKNEELYQWIEGYQWELKSEFYLSESQFLSDQLELYFPNVDTYAAIYILSLIHI
jgi:beta-mannosidase